MQKLNKLNTNKSATSDLWHNSEILQRRTDYDRGAFSVAAGEN